MVLASVVGKVGLCQMLAFRHRLPSAVIRRFYTAFIGPKLEYCSAVWCGASSSSLRHLERLQLKLAKAITRHWSPQSSPSDILAAAHMPTLAWRRRLHCLSLLWQLLHGQGPPQLEGMLPCSAPLFCSSCTLRSGHALEFPLSSTYCHLSSFLCTTIPVWNSLPSDLASACSLSSFRFGTSRHFLADQFTFGLQHSP